MTSKYRLLAFASILPLLSIIGVVVWEINGVVRLPKPTDLSPIPVHEFSHEPWDKLLHRFVDDQGRVAYREWKGSVDSQASLDDYLTQAGRVVIESEASKLDVLAYWINLYNALTVKGILREYPTRSILDHVRPIGYHFWKDLKVFANGAYRSLDDIEHTILRKMGEPRIHFITLPICCAEICQSKRCSPSLGIVTVCFGEPIN